MPLIDEVRCVNLKHLSKTTVDSGVSKYLCITIGLQCVVVIPLPLTVDIIRKASEILALLLAQAAVCTSRFFSSYRHMDVFHVYI